VVRLVSELSGEMSDIGLKVRSSVVRLPQYSKPVMSEMLLSEA